MSHPVLKESDWWQQTSVLHPLTVGATAFAVLSLYLRLSSSRTMSRTNVITWISSVAIGSLLAQIVSNTDLDLVRGLLSLFLFLAVDYATTFGMTRSKKLQELLRGRPVLCVFKGKILEEECRSNRVERPLLLQALRTHGLVSFEQVEVMILETTGSFSVLSKDSMAGQDDAEALLSEAVPHYRMKLEHWRKEGHISDSKLPPV